MSVAGNVAVEGNVDCNAELFGAMSVSLTTTGLCVCLFVCLSLYLSIFSVFYICLCYFSSPSAHLLLSFHSAHSTLSLWMVFLCSKYSVFLSTCKVLNCLWRFHWEPVELWVRVCLSGFSSGVVDNLCRVYATVQHDVCIDDMLVGRQLCRRWRQCSSSAAFRF